MWLFNKKGSKDVTDIKALRDALLYFIRRKLSAAEGGEGTNIRGLQLFFDCPDAERPAYESAVYFTEESRFRKEIQRIADDYAIGLPDDWSLELTFTGKLPESAEKIEGTHAALWVRTAVRSAPTTRGGVLRVLQGEAEQQQYVLQPAAGRINIGRDREVRGTDGFMRINAICFPATSTNEANKFISRQHAHIEYDAASGQFFLFADEGGIPPHNKVKVRGRNDAHPQKLQSMQVPHKLADGDQVMLGDAAVLEFTTGKQ